MTLPSTQPHFTIHKTPRFPKDYYDSFKESCTYKSGNIKNYHTVYHIDDDDSKMEGDFVITDEYFYSDYDIFTTAEEQQELTRLQEIEKEEIKRLLKESRRKHDEMKQILGRKQTTCTLMEKRNYRRHEPVKIREILDKERIIDEPLNEASTHSTSSSTNVVEEEIRQILKKEHISLNRTNCSHNETDDQKMDVQNEIRNALRTLKNGSSKNKMTTLEKAETKMHLLVKKFFDKIHCQPSKNLCDELATDLIERMEDTLENTGLKLQSSSYCESMIQNLSDMLLNNTSKEFRDFEAGLLGGGSRRFS